MALKTLKTRDWLNTINQDKQFQNDQRHQIWHNNLMLYLGRFHHLNTQRGATGGHVAGTGFFHDLDFVNVNFVYAYIKTVMPAIYFKDPHIFVEARQEDDIPKASVIEAVINYIWREINLKEEVKRVILDTLIFGLGWLKIGCVFPLYDIQSCDLR